jgi:hypothetical protein
MAQPEPYIEAHPGELITAQAWNEVQVEIREDIAEEIEAAKEDIRHTGVDKAKDADEFAGRSSTTATRRSRTTTKDRRCADGTSSSSRRK